MHVQPHPLAGALLAAISTLTLSAQAQTSDVTLPEISVSAVPFNATANPQILTPAKVLSGDELRDKLDNSLGATLSHELGVSSSAFGAGAARPIVRGLDGARVKILQNGLSVSDVSSLSADHAVAAEASTAQQIEILRGPAALLYGSGAIGGLINIVNNRIPHELTSQPTGETELRYSSVDHGRAGSVAVDGSVGKIGLHLDANDRYTDDYQIPGNRLPNDSTSTSGRLPFSYTHQGSLGIGAALVESWGHLGASIGTQQHRYGVPTINGAQIDQHQTRYDIDGLLRQPFAGFESLQVKFGHTDYRHTELDTADIAQTRFANRAFESRWELKHQPLDGWRGTFGMQTEHSRFSALSAADGAPDTVAPTKSDTLAGFLVEEKTFGALRLNAGLRFENVRRAPLGGADRSFNLGSYSVGGLWEFAPGYGFGGTASIAQRAPAIDELYSAGPHDASGTFDKGNANLSKERSRNLELTLQKTSGQLRWKANLFHNRVKNFIYGRVDGNRLNADGSAGDEFYERIFSQGDATIRGAEAEISYQTEHGLTLRGFADTSRGTLDNAGNLPLQPATRIGIDINYRSGAWRAGANLLHALKQDRLASFETSVTPSYTQLDANLSYTQRYAHLQLTWFLLAKNLLNQDVRLSTSLLKDVAPLPGRNIIVGVRSLF